MTSPTPDAALALASAALGAEPAGLLTDLDGTLAPIVADPAAVALEAGAETALRALAGRLAVTGIVTGRAAADARAIAGVRQLLVVGNHGLEWLEPMAEQPTPAPEFDWAPGALGRLIDEVQAAVPISGVTFDAKGLSATIHYRRATDPAVARARILASLAAADPDRIEVREGRMSVELRPAGAGDKGVAVREVVARHRLRGLVVAGDDTTDLDMFHAAAELRAAGRVTAAILAVGGGAEVPPAVAGAADAVLPSVAAFVALLGRLAR
jgi:trehalose 6-phosphate phosphatase